MRTHFFCPFLNLNASVTAIVEEVVFLHEDLYKYLLLMGIYCSVFFEINKPLLRIYLFIKNELFASKIIAIK